MDDKIFEVQMGCGYCIHEKNCPKRDPKINKAKLGCLEYEHHLKSKITTNGTEQRITSHSE